MDLTTARNAEHLPCGAEVAALLDQVAAGDGGRRSGHQATCPHCSALLPELDRLWAPISALAREEVLPPPGLVTAVMRQVRRLVAAAWLRLRTGARGTTRVARWVVAKLGGLAAREVAGVHEVLSTVADVGPAGGPGPAAGSAPAGSGPTPSTEVASGRAALQLDLATEYGQSIPAIAQAVRSAVVGRVQDMTGLEVTEVDITVGDVRPRPDPSS